MDHAEEDQQTGSTPPNEMTTSQEDVQSSNSGAWWTLKAADDIDDAIDKKRAEKQQQNSHPKRDKSSSRTRKRSKSTEKRSSRSVIDSSGFPTTENQNENETSSGELAPDSNSHGRRKLRSRSGSRDRGASRKSISRSKSRDRDRQSGDEGREKPRSSRRALKGEERRARSRERKRHSSIDKSKNRTDSKDRRKSTKSRSRSSSRELADEKHPKARAKERSRSGSRGKRRHGSTERTVRKQEKRSSSADKLRLSNSSLADRHNISSSNHSKGRRSTRKEILAGSASSLPIPSGSASSLPVSSPTKRIDNTRQGRSASTGRRSSSRDRGGHKHSSSNLNNGRRSSSDGNRMSRFSPNKSSSPELSFDDDHLNPRAANPAVDDEDAMSPKDVMAIEATAPQQKETKPQKSLKSTLYKLLHPKHLKSSTKEQNDMNMSFATINDWGGGKKTSFRSPVASPFKSPSGKVTLPSQASTSHSPSPFQKTPDSQPKSGRYGASLKRTAKTSPQKRPQGGKPKKPGFRVPAEIKLQPKSNNGEDGSVTSDITFFQDPRAKLMQRSCSLNRVLETQRKLNKGSPIMSSGPAAARNRKIKFISKAEMEKRIMVT